MLTAIRFPAPKGRHGSAWERIGRRRALVLPILNCGVSLALHDDERLAWARIGMGPVAPVPFRARETEAFLAGRPATKEAFAEATEIVIREAQPRSSLLRASREYRIEVLQVLVRQGLARAVEQARARAAVQARARVP
jgi:carbon-monoxide dehydrogenase medium subunit